ncbi:MAG: 4'-phosphopantetheinyl transferase superfamily protein [Candidatus Saccharimonas sp.]|nr:4'-phosphopantetheinyl transferase superfamily protein [Planctomycetaceae bacterium]
MNASHWPTLTEPLPLASDIVHVARLDLNPEPNRIGALRSVLSPDELIRADRYKFDEPRRRFIVCRAALRQLLGSCLDCGPESLKFVYGPHGKPMWEPNAVTSVGSSLAVPANRAVEFGVSHSADLALIAITVGRRVGVDVEQHDAKVRILKLAARFFSPREAAQLASLPECDQLAGFYRGWTCKEAYLKATGFGLSFPLSQFTVALNPREPAGLLEVIDQPDEVPRWRMHSLDVAPGFSAALLVEATAHESVEVQQWSQP